MSTQEDLDMLSVRIAHFTQQAANAPKPGEKGFVEYAKRQEEWLAKEGPVMIGAAFRVVAQFFTNIETIAFCQQERLDRERNR